MSLWQFAACVDGWNRVHGADGDKPEVTSADFDDMLERHADWMRTVH
jgi:hypothetical protein